jgi:SAM-dependent methyltransferase
VGDRAVDHFDALAERYAALRASSDDVDPLTEAVAGLVDLRGGRIVDIGCGPGTVIRQLVQTFDADAVGVDDSRNMIEVARREVGELARFEVGRAEDLPLEDESVDVALMRLVVHHLDRPRAFAELRRVLRSGGQVVITTTDPAGFDSFWMQPLFSSYAGIERRSFPDGAALTEELSAAGFREIRVHPYAIERRFSREEALEKLRGRAYSTFVLMSEEEYDPGLATAEATLPEEVRYELRLLNVVGK